ncbi:MAG: PAS domain S-box protein [Deltaproteobacteria bacterium]|nr:PAS domain S-box protein [Deltaproteobacteria bacterium]
MDPRDQELAELKAELERAKLSEAKYRAIFDAAPAGIAIHDADTGQFLDVNRCIIQMSGMADLTEQNFNNLGISPPFDNETALGKVHLAALGKPQTFEWKNFKAAGEDLWMEVHLQGLDLGGVRRVLAIVRDITHRKASELRLAESEERYRLLVENLDDMVFMLDPIGNFTFVSQALKEFSDFEQKEVVDHSFADFALPEDLPMLASEFLRCLSGEHVVAEFRVRVKDGSIHHVHTSSRPILRKDGSCEQVLGVMTDLTERKKNEEAKRLLEEQLHHSQKMEALGRLAGGVAHDFNNLLFVILNHTAMLGEDLDAEDPKHKSTQQIEKAVEAASNLTRQLLDFSRRQTIKPRVLDLHQVLDELADMLRRIVGEDVNLEFVKDEDIGPIKADSGRLGQVLMNLVVNARDAMPQGGSLRIETHSLDLDPSANFPALKPGPHVMLSVTDSGSGMYEAVREHAFEPFFTTKPGAQGTGLGLSTAYSVIRQFHGDIQLESKTGHGTTVRILLPVTHEQADAIPEQRVQVTPRVEGKSILLVEDEPIVRDLVKEMLLDFGTRVLSFDSAEATLADDRVLRDQFDLLITDVILPGISGGALAQKLQARSPDLAVLYISGYTGDAIAKQGLSEEDIILLQKPFRVSDLLTKIHQALARNTNTQGEPT